MMMMLSPKLGVLSAMLLLLSALKGLGLCMFIFPAAAGSF